MASPRNNIQGLAMLQRECRRQSRRGKATPLQRELQLGYTVEHQLAAMRNDPKSEDDDSDSVDGDGSANTFMGLVARLDTWRCSPGSTLQRELGLLTANWCTNTTTNLPFQLYESSRWLTTLERES